MDAADLEGIQYPSFVNPRTIWAPNDNEVYFSVDDYELSHWR